LYVDLSPAVSTFIERSNLDAIKQMMWSTTPARLTSASYSMRMRSLLALLLIRSRCDAALMYEPSPQLADSQLAAYKHFMTLTAKQQGEAIDELKEILDHREAETEQFKDALQQTLDQISEPREKKILELREEIHALKYSVVTNIDRAQTLEKTYDKRFTKLSNQWKAATTEFEKVTLQKQLEDSDTESEDKYNELKVILDREEGACEREQARGGAEGNGDARENVAVPVRRHAPPAIYAGDYREGKGTP
jgi:DNA-binding transcriptional MerR regulator